jgi:hypothetical protein
VSDLWWILSFAEAKPPHGRGFLGGALIKADTLAEAVTWTHRTGINPGGEILPVCFRSLEGGDPKYVNRLLDRDEARELPVPSDAVIVANPPYGTPPGFGNGASRRSS